MRDFSFVMNADPSFMEDLYQQYKADPSRIDPQYQQFFEGFDFALAKQSEEGEVSTSSVALKKEFAVYQLILDYKKKGHLIADTNPIRPRKNRNPQLELADVGLTESDLKSVFVCGELLGLKHATLEQIIARLRQLYCGKFGVEYTYIRDHKKVQWIEQRIAEMTTTQLHLGEKTRILEKLTEASIFENFLHKKYIGQKRFSLEGGENTLTAIDQILTTVAEFGAKESVIGMAHRGRLNVLANVLGKTYNQIFSEFEGMLPTDSTMGSGDVKYHMGFSSTIKTALGKELYLKLVPNPSHLETVGSVTSGYARSKAMLVFEKDTQKVVPIIIHGDASIAGQGIVYELLQMSDLEGYRVGGSIHIVINNQIGFTTDFFDARSSDYSTSVAATVQAPVFHVNGDDAETVAKVSKIAAMYRQTFGGDVFVDILCYRKHGHNEGDDPKYTQPKLYEIIEHHKNPREVYVEQLSKNSPQEATLAVEMENAFWEELQNRLDEVKQKPLPYTLEQYKNRWDGIRKATEQDFKKSPKTRISKKALDSLIKHLLVLPEDFHPLPKVKGLLKEKWDKYTQEQKIDWATGELLAYGSLLHDGVVVRLSGQDVSRGTFSHRHVKVLSTDGETMLNRLSNLPEKKADIFVHNSLLSEYAVLGFEYGFSMCSPHMLVIWEAQFGDFANGAQIIIDQYIAAAEQKWGVASGLTLLLPHGYEGQGPEHSSARLERMLQLCAENNMYVTNITTAANFFHVLRRQMKVAYRKPLINFSPKANLRHPDAASHVDLFTQGDFQEIIHDDKVNPNQVERVLVCSGKIYFSLDLYRQQQKLKHVAIVRIEQFYPFPTDQWEATKKIYKSAKHWVWVQEEPRNMGAMSFLKINVWETDQQMKYVARPTSASTATGFYKKHFQEEETLIQQAFSI